MFVFYQIAGVTPAGGAAGFHQLMSQNMANPRPNQPPLVSDRFRILIQMHLSVRPSCTMRSLRWLQILLRDSFDLRLKAIAFACNPGGC